MFRCNRQKLVDALLETISVLLPEQVMQEDAHRVHAEGFGPAKFLVDLFRIKSRLLPHFQLIDRRARNVIAPNKPRLLCVPFVRKAAVAYWEQLHMFKRDRKSTRLNSSHGYIS